ncbi:MAG: major royal jelly family protein [Beggiatoa sp.]|nr:major royal jelly family protein [Beggiatoa sp.]
MRKRARNTRLLAVLGAVAGATPMSGSGQQAAQERRPQSAASLPAEKTVGALEQVIPFTGPMLTGVTVADDGRIFINHPRWSDPVEFTVAKIKSGQPVAYPNAQINKLDTARAGETFVSVQSVVVDPRNRLWVLDTGSVKFEPVVPNGPKLVGIDLAMNGIIKTPSSGKSVRELWFR